MTWQKIPFVRLLLPFLLGVLVYPYVNSDFVNTILRSSLAVSGVGVFLLYQVRSPSMRLVRIWGISLTLVLCQLGYVVSSQQDQHYQPEHLLQAPLSDSSLTYKATIVSTIKLNEKSLRTTLQLEALQDSTGNWQATKGKIIAYFALDTNSVHLRYGNQLLLQSTIRQIPPPPNPMGFDAANYYAQQHIYHQTYIPTAHWQITKKENGSWLTYQLQAIQSYLRQTLKQYIKGENEQAVAIALLLGAKDELSQDIKNAYADTGAMHILAVSGMHVGIVVGMLLWLLTRLGITNSKRKKLRLFLALATLWAFVLLTGAAASVLRAATMFSFILIGQALGRQINIYNSLAASAFLLLCYNSSLIYQVGFQLSYLALIGIVYYHPKIYRLFYFEHTILDKLWSGLAVSLAAQLATLPVGLYYFHQFPVFFWLSGIVVTVAAGVLLLLGIALLALSWIPILSTLLGTLLYYALWAMNSLIFLIQKLPAAVWEGFWLQSWEVYVGYGVLMLFTYTILSRQLKHSLLPLMIVVCWGAYKLQQQYNNSQQYQLVVYQARKQSLLTVIQGNKAINIASEALLQTPALQYLQQNHLWSLGVQSVTNHTLENDTLTNDYCYYKHQVLATGQKKVLIVNADYQDQISYVPIEVDYVMLSGNPKLKNLQQLDDLCTYQHLLFDASNSYWNIQKWKKQCETLKISYTDISTTGAVIENIGYNPALVE